MAFYDNSRMKIDIIEVCFAIPVNQSELKEKKITQYNSLVNYYELFFKFPGNNIFHYNGQCYHMQNHTVGFHPHYATKTLNPPVKEYYIETYQDSPSINIFFKCDDILANNAEYYDCERYYSELRPLFEKAHNLWNSKNTGYYADLISVFYKIMSTLQKKNSPSYIPGFKYDMISSSIDYLDKHYLDPNFSCAELSAISNISNTYYTKIFIEKFGVTPKKYVTTRKLEHARELLHSTPLSVTEISDISGFTSLYNFSRAFKNHFGISPENYRNSIK